MDKSIFEALESRSILKEITFYEVVAIAASNLSWAVLSMAFSCEKMKRSSLVASKYG